MKISITTISLTVILNAALVISQPAGHGRNHRRPHSSGAVRGHWKFHSHSTAFVQSLSTPEPTVAIESPSEPEPTAIETPSTPEPTVAVESPSEPDPTVAIESPSEPEPTIIETPATPEPTVAVESPSTPQPTVVVQSPSTPKPTTPVASVPTPQSTAVTGSLWTPQIGDTWNYLIGVSGLTADTATASGADIVDIDLFDNSATVIAGIKAKNVKVICYFSAGTYEPNRPDSASFTAADKGKVMPDWPAESWLDIRTSNVQNIMLARVQLAADKGCDGIEPDNVDAYGNDNGLGLTAQDSITLVSLLAAKATSLNVSIGLKNAADIVPDLVSKVQYAVNEQCVGFDECSLWQPFTTAKKPVFHVEYPNGVPNLDAAEAAQFYVSSFSTILKDIDVTAATQFCPDGSQVLTS